MGARPSPVIDAGEQLDSRKVRGHGLLCEHRSALRAPRISPSTDPYRRRAARRHRSHAEGTRALVRQSLYSHQVFDKIELFFERIDRATQPQVTAPICCVATIFVAACYTKVYSSRSFTEDGPRMI